MSSKGFILSLVVVISCVQLGQGLICYEHDFCLGGGCQDVLNRTRVCDSNQSNCWKLTVTEGTKRGCGDGECKVQVNAGVIKLANVCCSKDYCNSATQFQKTVGMTLLLSFITLIKRLY